MKPYHFSSLVSNVPTLGATALLLIATPASARMPVALPEPTLWSLLGVGVVVAIIIKRLRDGK